MLGMQLEALSIVEVRRLLDLARARGQDGLARQLETELAARPGRTPGRPITMSAAYDAAPRAMPPPAPAYRRVARQRRSAPAIAVAGLAALIGGGLAWGVNLSPPQAPPPKSLAVNTSGPAPRIAVALTTTAQPEETASPLAEEPAAPALVAEPPRETPAAEPSRNPCLDLPTAQERLVCGYPSLAIMDRRMKAALDKARANGSDVKAIEDSQASWQRGSANVSDRLALGDRYAQRIAELEAE